jgi:hypothetical protein
LIFFIEKVAVIKPEPGDDQNNNPIKTYQSGRPGQKIGFDPARYKDIAQK